MILQMMDITHASIKVRDLVKGYQDDNQTGRVSAYDGKLDIRPAYQREFIYKDKQNIFRWATKNDFNLSVL